MFCTVQLVPKLVKSTAGFKLPAEVFFVAPRGVMMHPAMIATVAVT
jgi:hypothetical protein